METEYKLKIVKKESHIDDVKELPVNMVSDLKAAETYRFILHSMDAFRIAVYDELGRGEIKYSVGQSISLADPGW